jgi:2-keto-3-deoxy-L-rhamnonate aldolase RhmA
MAIANPLAERLQAGGLGLALMIRHARTPDIAVAARTCGFDALYYDLQHTSMPEDAVAQVAVAAQGAGITPLVRVPDKDYAAALRMLDSGAMGIVMPDVNSAADAAAAVQHCKFAPIGNRGAYGSWPQLGYRAVPAVEARAALNAATLLIVMIENRGALDNVEAIAAVPGVDIVHMGSNDLATDLGVPGELTHPKVLAGVERLVAACRKHGKTPGIGGLTGGDTKRIEQVVALGARFLTAANEWNLMLAAGHERVRALRALNAT